MSKKAMVWAGLCVCLLAWPAWVEADTIFSNLGPFVSSTDPGYDGYVQGSAIAGGYQGAFSSFGAAFTPTGDFHLTSITAAIAHVFAQNAGPVTISILTDSGGRPGSVIESIFPFGSNPDFIGLRPAPTADSVLQPLLFAGNQYWLIASTADPRVLSFYHANSMGDVGPLASGPGGLGGPWQISFGTRPAFRVEGTPVPEPNSFLLLGTGMAGFVAFLCRRGGRFKGDGFRWH